MENEGQGEKNMEEGPADKGWLLLPQLVAGGTGVTSVCATAGAERGHPGAAAHEHIRDQEKRLRTRDRH